MPLEFRTLHKGFATFCTDVHARPVGMQVLPHRRVVPEHLGTSLRGRETTWSWSPGMCSLNSVIIISIEWWHVPSQLNEYLHYVKKATSIINACNRVSCLFMHFKFILTNTIYWCYKQHCTHFVWTSYRPGCIVFFYFSWLHSAKEVKLVTLTICWWWLTQLPIFLNHKNIV